MFPDIVDAFVQNGGRIKFNLSELTLESGVTVFELRHIMSSPKLMAATDFFLDGELLQGAKLEATLKPWRTTR
ncbi:MAG: hypothetical protein R3B48_08760 [Kofleriaceae bacterium]